MLTAVSIIVDIVIISVPLTLFRNLQVSKKTKIAIISLCCLGVFTCVCAVVKTALLPALFSTNPDKTWNLAQLCLWAPLEICVGMICGSAPCLKPLLSAFRGRRNNAPSSYYELEPGRNAPVMGSMRMAASMGTHVPTKSLVPTSDNAPVARWNDIGGMTSTKELAPSTQGDEESGDVKWMAQ